MTNDERLSLVEAAKELDTTSLKVLMLLKRNALRGTMVDETWYVDRASLDRFREQGMDLHEEVECRKSCKASSCGCHGM